MSGFADYERYDATGLARLVADGETTPAELLAAFEERVAARNPVLGAVVHPAFDQAAQAIEHGLPAGPFTGVPYLIKDLHVPVAGLPLSSGSRLFAGLELGFDSELVARLRRAGFVIAGRTKSPELGANATTEPRLGGPCRNPWNPAHSAGGSSGGAAAAVAGGLLPAAHATDSLGSIRIPAACCGLVGLKPTRGRNPLGPHRGDAMMGFGHEHCITRTVRDCAAILDATHGPDEGALWFAPAPTRPFRDAIAELPPRLRIGLVTAAWNGAPVHADCVAAVERAGRLCEARGHRVAPMAMAIDGAALDDAANTIFLSGVAGLVAQREAELGRPAGDDLEPATLDMAAAGRAIPATALHGALARLNRIVRAAAGHFRDVDVILTPTAAEPPPRLGALGTDVDARRFLEQLMRYAAFTPLFSATGQPAISLPLHRSPAGLPIGVQAVGRFGDDATLLQLAAELEIDFIGRPALRV